MFLDCASHCIFAQTRQLLRMVTAQHWVIYWITSNPKMTICEEYYHCMKKQLLTNLTSILRKLHNHLRNSLKYWLRLNFIWTQLRNKKLIAITEAKLIIFDFKFFWPIIIYILLLILTKVAKIWLIVKLTWKCFWEKISAFTVLQYL